MFRKILILAPHPDDEILGCGGTIARAVADGAEVHIAIMTNAHVGAPDMFPAEQVRNVRAEAREAHERLGVTRTHYLDLPAPRLDQYPQFRIADEAARLVGEIAPDTLMLPHTGDMHLDHGAVFNAGMVAARPQGNYSVRFVLAYETLSETDWAPPERGFVPNFFVRLTDDDLQRKLHAMEAFESQLRQFPHPRTLRALQALAEVRGATVGTTAAESFILARGIF